MAPLVPMLRYEKLNWRMVARAGGATVKPDDFYRLYALHMQVCRLPLANSRAAVLLAPYVMGVGHLHICPES